MTVIMGILEIRIVMNENTKVVSEPNKLQQVTDAVNHFYAARAQTNGIH